MQPIEVRLSIEVNYAGLHPNQRIRGCERFQRTTAPEIFPTGWTGWKCCCREFDEVRASVQL